MRLTHAILAVLGPLAGSSLADEIVQEGTLSGSAGGPHFHTIELDPFDDLGGRRVLNFVRVDLLTSTIGGATSTGSGVAVAIDVTLSADYLLGPQVLAETEAVIDFDHPNTGPPTAFSVFDTDTAQVLVDAPADLTAWTGAGRVTLTGVTEFHVSVVPPDEMDFSAGGTVRYTVTYDYDVVAGVPAMPVPALGLLALLMLLLGCRVLQTRTRPGGAGGP